MSFAGEIEDGWTPRAKAVPRGRPIDTMEPRRLSGDELLIHEILYQTIVDCYKITTGCWNHFVWMDWHSKAFPDRILATARRCVEEWINSDTFFDYVKISGWNPHRAVPALQAMLDGKADIEQVRRLIAHIGKERDVRRNRGENV